MKITPLDFINGKVSAEDLYEEMASLGLNKKAKDKFSSKSDGEAVEELNEVTYDDILNLYKKYGKIQPDWQTENFPGKRQRVIDELSLTIGRTYSKFIISITNKEYWCRFTNAWGEEKLDAIEFWDNTIEQRRLFSNRIYGEEKYFTEVSDDFFTNKKNFILDWFIPATLKWLEKTPKARHYFLRDKVNESKTSLGLNKQAKKKFNDIDAIDNISGYVDLGLPSGTLWCKCNYGADEEYEVGDYIDYFDMNSIEKSSQIQIPSIEDFKELIKNCTFKPGKKGQKLISKLNGNSIFLQLGGYWTSTKKLSGVKLFEYYVTINDISTEYHSTANAHRYDFLLRPVLKRVSESTNSK